MYEGRRAQSPFDDSAADRLRRMGLTDEAGRPDRDAPPLNGLPGIPGDLSAGTGDLQVLRKALRLLLLGDLRCERATRRNGFTSAFCPSVSATTSPPSGRPGRA